MSAPVNYLNLTVKRPNKAKNVVDPKTEPRSVWAPESDGQKVYKYNTTTVRLQLGATSGNPSYADRGVMEISEESLRVAIDGAVKTAPMPSGPAYGPEVSRPSWDLFARHGTHKAQGSVAFCAGCVDDWYGKTTLFWEHLFTDIIAETNSPARAVQAVNTALARMAYMRWIPAFSESAEASIVRLVDARAPVRAIGFILVMTMVAVQIILLAIATVMFRATRYSTLNDAWRVVAHVSSSSALADILARAPSDREVKKLVEAERNGVALLGVEGAVDTDTVRARSTGRFILWDGAFRRSARG